MNDTAKDTADGAGQWWDPGLLARWIGANAAAYLVVVGGDLAHACERFTLVGAENSVAASDQRLRPQPTVQSPSAGTRAYRPQNSQLHPAASTARCSASGAAPDPERVNQIAEPSSPAGLDRYDHHRGHIALGGYRPARPQPADRTARRLLVGLAVAGCPPWPRGDAYGG